MPINSRPVALIFLRASDGLVNSVWTRWLLHSNPAYPSEAIVFSTGNSASKLPFLTTNAFAWHPTRGFDDCAKDLHMTVAAAAEPRNALRLNLLVFTRISPLNRSESRCFKQTQRLSIAFDLCR